MNVTLVMFKADGTRRDFPISKGRVIVGRTSNCDLRIPLPSVSRQHCEIRIEGDKITVRDLGSSNGTYHNRTRVQEATLEAGDQILVGPVLFTVVIDGKPRQPKPPATPAPLVEPAPVAALEEEAPVLEDELPVLEDEGDIEELLEGAALEEDAVALEDEDEVVALTDEQVIEEAPPGKAPPAEELTVAGEQGIPLDESEVPSPTVDLDDPIAALEAMAAAEGPADVGDLPLLEEEDQPKSARGPKKRK